LHNYLEELENTIREARAVSEDLEVIMQKSTSIAEHIVEIIDKRAAESPDSTKTENNACGYESGKFHEEELEKLKEVHPYIAVRTLHAKGYTVNQIARMLDRGQGEVNLILNITKKSKRLYG